MSAISTITVPDFEQALLSLSQPPVNPMAANTRNQPSHHLDQPSLTQPSGSKFCPAGLGVAGYGLWATATLAAAHTGRRPCSTLENKHTHVNCRMKRKTQ